MERYSQAIERLTAVMGNHDGNVLDSMISDDNEIKHEDYINKVLHDINSQPILEDAELHRHLNSLRVWKNQFPTEYPFLTSSTWKIGEYSLGFALHFTFIKQMILIMFTLSIFSILPLIINFRGKYFTYSEIQTDLDYLSIGNIYGRNPTSNSTFAQDKSQDQYHAVWISDSVCSAVFLLFVLAFCIYMYMYVPSLLKRQARVSDFTVEVKGLPRKGVDAKMVEEHFSRFGEVAEIFLGRRFGEFLPLYKEKTAINEQKMIREALMNFKNIDPETDKEYMKLKEKLRKCQLRIVKKGKICKFEELELKSAYVVFKNDKDRNDCLKKYNEKNCCGCKKRRRRLRFNKIHLDVRQANEPSDIIWENLEVGFWSRMFRKLVSLVLTLVLLFISIIIIFYVKTAQGKIPSELTCSSFDLTEKGSSVESTQRLCYCKNLNENDLFKQTNNCYYYLGILAYSAGIKFLSSFGIIIINFFLKTIMRKLSDFEKPQSRSYIQKIIFRKIFLAIFINTAVLIYILNLSALESLNSIYGGTVKYSEFTREWYLRVGSYVLIIMIVAMFSPHLFYLAILYPIGVCRRKYCYKSKQNQYELNLLFTGPDFDIAARTAQILNVIFSCYFYSSGIPLLNCCCLVFLTIIFYTDKWLVLRHFRKPVKYDQQIYLSLLKMLPCAVILHCCVSLYAFGSNEIFEVGTLNIEFINKIFPPTYAEKITKPSGVSNSLLIIAAILIIITINFIDLTCFCILKRNIKSSESQDFIDMKEEIERRGLASYDIRKNPDYAMIINEMDESVGFNRKRSEGVFENSKLKKTSSRSPLKSPDKKDLIDENENEDATSHNGSNPDLSRDEKEEIDLKLNSIKSPQVNLKYKSEKSSVKNESICDMSFSNEFAKQSKNKNKESDTSSEKEIILSRNSSDFERESSQSSKADTVKGENRRGDLNKKSSDKFNSSNNCLVEDDIGEGVNSDSEEEIENNDSDFEQSVTFSRGSEEQND